MKKKKLSKTEQLEIKLSKLYFQQEHLVKSQREVRDDFEHLKEQMIQFKDLTTKALRAVEERRHLSLEQVAYLLNSLKGH